MGLADEKLRQIPLDLWRSGVVRMKWLEAVPGLFKSLRMVAGVGMDRKIMSLELKSFVDVGECAGECLEVSR